MPGCEKTCLASRYNSNCLAMPGSRNFRQGVGGPCYADKALKTFLRAFVCVFFLFCILLFIVLN